MIFDLYLFADYSGAQAPSPQRRAIRLAEAGRGRSPVIVQRRLTRTDLGSEFASRLREATARGMRVCFGQDHQYGIPYSLLTELSLDQLPWRTSLERLSMGSYGVNSPPLAHPRIFAPKFNAWLQAQGKDPYFYSATKAALYGVPSRNPRPADSSTYRLTELRAAASGAGSPKAFNRVGDNGTVGGQSLVGMLALRDLLSLCQNDGIPVAAWPFDGLSLDAPSYEGAHVLLEPYPTAVRLPNVAQSDESDALATAAHVAEADARGDLARSLDLRELNSAEEHIVRREGWILSHQPNKARR